MSRHVTLFAIVAALATIPACASAPAAGTPANTTSANVDILTADEIADRNLGDRSLLDIIRLVRSQYLNFHGKSGTTASAGRVQVSFGTQSLSSVDDLANVTPPSFRLCQCDRARSGIGATNAIPLQRRLPM